HNEGRPLHARLTLAALHGGDKGSALPERLEILVNRRYAPEEDFAAVRAEIDETIARAMAGSAALEVSTQMIGHLAPVADPT
ncbi:peptidase dimerization domain-containing protein, partial [Salmonella enterica]|uniref:peptidase dimerization domain-containing protein n=1 Tax=Salmonella enterica TaxID=28901 RepID=UPI003D2B42E6